LKVEKAADDLEIVFYAVMDFAKQDVLLVERQSDPVLLVLPVGNIDDRGKHHRPGFGFDRVQSDLDREFSAVLAQRIQIAAGAHGTG
jgi:hypothetical protein